MLFPRFTQSAVALLLLTIGFAAPARSQQNQQIISGNWYEDRASASAAAGGITLTFVQTPTNQFLNVTNVSCDVIVTSNQVIAAMNLFSGKTAGADDLGRDYSVKGNPTPETSGGSKYYSIVQNGILFKFGPGRFPSILINTAPPSGSPSIIASCVIVGNLTDN